MKIVMLSDVHLVAKNPVSRLDDLVETQFEKLEFVLRWAKEHNAIILQAGDMFNVPRSWLILPRVIGLLKEYGVSVYGVYGQHDTYMYNEETRDRTNLGVLAKAGLVKILGEEGYNFCDLKDENTVVLYGASWGQAIPKVADENKFNILVVHADISERAAYPGQEFTRAKWFLERHSEYQIVLCGDVHMEFMAKDKGRFLADTGPMVRKEATEYNMTHLPNFLVYDTETDKVSKVFIPCKPASEVLDRDRLLKAGMVSTMLDDFIGELQNGGTEGEEVSFDEFLMTFIRDNKIPASVVRLISERMEVRQNGN